MTIKFRSATIPGTHGEIKLGAWGIGVSRTEYNGVTGVSEQRGERRGRTITWDAIWHNSYLTAALLEAAIENLAKDAPINGKIEETGAITRNFERCTLEAIELLRGPLPSVQVGYWREVRFHFFQLAPNP